MTSTSARAEQIAAFYDRHADRLQRIVARQVHAPARGSGSNGAEMGVKR